jgi:hypothetical protein
MDITPMLLNSIWAGLFAAALAVVLTAPPQAIVPSTAVVVAAATCVLLGLALTSRRRSFSVIAIVTGVLPLGAAVALFNSIKGILNMSGLKEQALVTASAQLSANLSAVFTTTFAMVLGIGVGFLIARLLKWKSVLQDVPET